MAKDSKKDLRPSMKVDDAIKEHGVDEYIQKFLYLINDNTLNDKSERDSKNETIRRLFKKGFTVSDPKGTMKIGSKVIQQCLWRVMSKLKFLDYDIHITGKDPSTERLTTEGVGTVMDRGDLSTCFRDKGGVFQNACMYGDGFLMYGKGMNDENPVQYRVIKNEDVYADSFAFGVRGVKPANKMAVIYAYDKEEAYNLWPELEEKNIYGKIPGTYHDEDRDLDKRDQDILEVCWGYDKSAQKHVVFAGVQAEGVELYKDEEYPFIKDDKPFIPVFQFMCQPSEDGFWNYGIGDMVYDLAVMTRRLLNMQVGHVEENVYPLTLINAPQSKVDELVGKMAMANKARANGLKPVVAMEFDAAGGQNAVSAQSLLTQSLASEWQMVWDKLYLEIARLGIPIDDIDRGTGVTATQIYAEEATQNAFVQQMMEYNASETKSLIECSMDGITEFVGHKNKTPLNLRTRIRMPDGATAPLDKEVTMGMLSKQLKEDKPFVIVNARTGASKSDLMKMTAIQSQIAITAPGTPEYAELYRQLSVIRGLDVEATPPPAPEGAPTEGAPGNVEVPPGEQVPPPENTPGTVNADKLAAIMGATPA